MTNVNVEVFVTHISDKGAAFGIRMDLSEEVYIQQQFTRRLQFEVGDTVVTTLIQNVPELRERTPWMAVDAQLSTGSVSNTPAPAPEPEPEPEPAMSNATLDARILKLLHEHQFGSTREIADKVNTDTIIAGNALQRLFTKGRCVKASVYRSPTQETASFTIWASCVDDLLGMGSLMEDE